MKRQNFINKILSLVMLLALIAGLALSMTSCGKNTEDGDNSSITASTSSIVKQELGQGNVKFDFIVADKNGNETYFLISTDEKTLADALLKLNLIEGEESQYGLFVKKVNGITADYDIDQTYWALLVDGEYSNVGADSVNVENGKTYKFAVSK